MVLNIFGTVKKSKSLLDIKEKTKKKKINVCDFYKFDIIGKSTPNLYKSCVVNSTCRKTKCKDVDERLYKSRFKKFGMDYNKIVNNISKQCSDDLSLKSKKKCVGKILEKFHDDNKLGNIYKQYLECDKKTCNKEKKIFHINLIRQKKIKYKKQKKIENEVNNDIINPKPLKMA
jgi:hypothetical protein